MRRVARVLGVSLLASGMVLLVLSCAGGTLPGTQHPTEELPPGAPPVPTLSDPWFGTAGNVLISDRNNDKDSTLDFLWIGFNSSSNWQKFLALHSQYPNGSYWIGGRVVVDAKNPLGFYFHPDTTASAEITAEGLQTGLDAIKENPAYFADFGCCWYVWAYVEGVREGSNASLAFGRSGEVFRFGPTQR